MKKQILTTLVTSALGCAAFAGSLSLDARADLENQSPNDAARAAGGVGSNSYTRFNLQTLRLDGKGNFNDATSFRLRFRLNSGDTAGTKNQRDSLNSSVDFGYIQHKLMDNLSLQLGKFTTDIGGIEGITSGADLYFNSVAWTDENSLRYSTGVKAMYTMADQEVDVMVMNEEVDAKADAAAASTSNFNQTRNAAGIVYKGSFMDKSLMPILNYFEDNLQPTGTTAPASLTDKKYAYATVGLKYDFAPIFVELDYHMNTYKNKSIADEKDKTNSFVGTVGYKVNDNWVAKAKYEGSEVETFTAASTSRKDKYNAYQVAAEYMPSGDKNFRYHVAYVSRDTKMDLAGTAGDTRTTQSVFVGTRLLADFLK